MTRDQVKAGLRKLDALRARMINARSEREERELRERYAEVTELIAPYVEGRKAFKDAA